MGLFRRSTPTGPTGAGPDPEFPMLDRQRAADFRQAVIDDFRAKGMEVVVTDGYVAAANGDQYGLDNIVRLCADATTPREMREFVSRHFANIFDQPDLDDFSPDGFRAALRLRLIPEYQAAGHRGTGPESAPLARPFGPGAVAALVVDTPTTVITPSESAMLRRGDADELLRIARENTWREVTTSPIERFRTGGKADDWAMSALGESFVTASAALFLPEILRHWHPGLDVSRGVLFSVPYRHRMLYRVVDGPESVIEGLPLMATLTAGGYRDEPGHVSPLCYLWHQGEVTGVSDIRDAGDGSGGQTLRLTPGPYLESVIDL